MRVGFIGLGDQGGPMAMAIHNAGFDVAVWARRESVRREWRAGGVRVVDDARTLAAGVDLLCLCVTDDAGVRALLIEQGLLAAMPRGGVVAVHSTILPDSCTELARTAERSGLVLLDMPVSGSGHAAAAGRLLVMAGGRRHAFDAIRPVIQSHGGTIEFMGGIGTAMRAKLINNLLVVVHIGLAYRALMLGQSLDIGDGALRRVLMAGTGRSFAIELIDRLQRPDKADHVRSLLEKDIGLALDIVAREDRPIWQAQAEAGLDALEQLGADPPPFTFEEDTDHVDRCKE